MLIHRLNSSTVAGIVYEASKDKGGGASDYEDVAKLISDLGNKIDKVMPDEVIESLKNLAKRNNSGSLDPVHKILFNDNHSLREKNRDLEEKTLSDGQVAVDKEKYELISVLEDHELTSKEDVENFIKESKESTEELQKVKRENKLNEARDIYGTNPKVLSKLLDDTMDVEIAEKEEDGEKKKIVNVIDSEGNKTELEKYVDENLADFKPALFNTEEENNTGKKWVPQNNNKKKKTSSTKVDDYIKNQKKKAKTGNPLKPKQEES